MSAHIRLLSRRANPVGYRRGTVLVAVLVALVVLQLVVVGIVVAGSRDHDLTARRAESLRAFYAEQGALQMAMSELVSNTDVDGDGVVGGVSSVTIGGGSATVTASTSGATTTLTATGTFGAAARRDVAGVRRTTTSGQGGVAVEVWLPASAPSSLASIAWSSTPAYTGVVPNIYFPSQTNSTPRFAGMPTSRIAMRFRAKITIATAGLWSFSTNSDDGSDLSVDGSQVVNNDGLHGMQSRSGSVTLTAGVHDIEVRYFENGGSNGLIVSWSGPGVPSSVPIPASAFTTTATMPALAAHSTMYLYGDNSANATRVDAYDSSAGAYGGANVQTASAVGAVNSTSAGAWQMNGRASLQGSAVVGPGGSPATVIQLSGSSSITGTQTAATSRVAIFSLQSSISSASNGSITLSGTGTQTISSSGRWTNLSLSGSSTLTLSGTTTLRVDGDITISNSASIALAAGADVDIYLSGLLTLSNDAVVNATATAGKLRIYMNGSAKDVTVNDRAMLSAYIWNPSGRLVISPLGNTPDSFSGRFFGGDVLTANKTDIHLDVAASGSGGGTTSNQTTSWTAVSPAP